MNRSNSELVAAAMVLPVYGTDANDATPDQRAANSSIYGVETAAEVVSKFRPAGLLLVERIPFHKGFADVKLGMLDSSERLRSFVEGVQEVARVEQMEPLLIVADQEGGAGSRLPGVALPAPAIIGGTRDSAVAKEAGRLTSQVARAHGVGVVLGPLADLGLGNAAIGDRAFSADPHEVARLAASWVSGAQGSRVQVTDEQGSNAASTGIVAVAKHWPGHGRANADSHVSVPVLDVDASVWASEELVPFAATINAQVAGILVAHLRAPSIDPSGALASQSFALTNKLRREHGFTGFTMTDALWMPSARTSAASDAQVAVRSFQAGIDLLLAPPDPAGTCTLASTTPDLSEHMQSHSPQSHHPLNEHPQSQLLRSSQDRITRLRSRHPAVDRRIDLDELNAEIQHFNATL